MNSLKLSIYPTADAQFLVSYLHPITKKRIRAYFKTQSEAENYKINIEGRTKKINFSKYDDLLVEDLIMLFLDDNTKTDLHSIKRHLADFTETFGHFKPTQITEPILKTWLNQIQKENNLKEITMKKLKSNFSTFFNFLVEKEILSESPLTYIYYKKQIPEVFSRNLLTPAEIKDLLEAIKSYSPGYLYPIVLLATETACKTSDLMDLTWNQINTLDKEIIFPKSIRSQERILEVSEELTNLLESKKQKHGLVFMTYYKEPFTKNKLARLINEFKITSKHPLTWSFMDLRHSFAVNFLVKHKDIKRLQYILGHNSIYDTKNLYGKVLEEKPDHKQIQNPYEIGS